MLEHRTDQQRMPSSGPSPGNYIFTGGIAGNTNYGVALDIGAKSTIVTNQTLGGGHAQLEGRSVRREFELRQQQMVRQRFDGDQQPGRRLHQMTEDP